MGGESWSESGAVVVVIPKSGDGTFRQHAKFIYNDTRIGYCTDRDKLTMTPIFTPINILRNL